VRSLRTTPGSLPGRGGRSPWRIAGREHGGPGPRAGSRRARPGSPPRRPLPRAAGSRGGRSRRTPGPRRGGAGPAPSPAARSPSAGKSGGQQVEAPGLDAAQVQGAPGRTVEPLAEARLGGQPQDALEAGSRSRASTSRTRRPCSWARAVARPAATRLVPSWAVALTRPRQRAGRSASQAVDLRPQHAEGLEGREPGRGGSRPPAARGRRTWVRARQTSPRRRGRARPGSRPARSRALPAGRGGSRGTAPSGGGIPGSRRRHVSGRDRPAPRRPRGCAAAGAPPRSDRAGRTWRARPPRRARGGSGRPSRPARRRPGLEAEDPVQALPVEPSVAMAQRLAPREPEREICDLSRRPGGGGVGQERPAATDRLPHRVVVVDESRVRRRAGQVPTAGGHELVATATSASVPDLVHHEAGPERPRPRSQRRGRLGVLRLDPRQQLPGRPDAEGPLGVEGGIHQRPDRAPGATARSLR